MSITAAARGDLRAYQDSVRLPTPELVARLRELRDEERALCLAAKDRRNNPGVPPEVRAELIRLGVYVGDTRWNERLGRAI